MIQRSIRPVLGLALAVAALAAPAVGAAEGKTPAGTNKEAKSGEGDQAKEGAKAAKKDPKAMNADEAEAAGLCPVCKNEHKLVYRVTIKDKAYHFATRECKKAFAADPDKYIAGTSAAGAAKKEGEPKKMPPEKEAAQKTEAAKKSEDAEKTEKAEDGGDMMGGDQMMGE